jgi:hypothetical protein
MIFQVFNSSTYGIRPTVNTGLAGLDEGIYEEEISCKINISFLSYCSIMIKRFVRFRISNSDELTLCWRIVFLFIIFIGRTL